MVRPVLPSVLGLSLAFVPALRAQERSYLLGAGLGAPSGAWKRGELPPGQHPVDMGMDGEATFEAGVAFLLAPRQELRLILGGTDGALANQQVALDWTCVVFQRWERKAFVLVGPTLNFISGNYTFRGGYEPPYGNGLRQYVDQRWRPGLKVGAGFQWSRHWSAELDLQLVSMKTSGYQSVPDAFSGYASAMATFHFGR